jgi:predicted nucleotidyltransferase component of viral defense system
MIISGNVSKKQMKAIDWFAQKLFSPQLSQHLYIRISYVKVDTHWGLAIIDGHNKRGYPREFIIEVNRSLTEHEKIMTLAHELVHIRQYAKMELNEEMNSWHGEYVNADVIPYHEQPWEIEAYDVGDKLFKEYINGNV